MPHALVVGGTGMLRRVVLELAREHEVTVLARGTQRLEELAAANPRVFPAACDYAEREALEATLEAAVRARGHPALAVAWIHSGAPSAPVIVARSVRGRFFHVLGSTAADPSLPDPGRRAAFEALPGLSYHEVILGFLQEGALPRWLTDAEIASGVLGAIRVGAPRTVVGAVTPWEARPS